MAEMKMKKMKENCHLLTTALLTRGRVEKSSEGNSPQVVLTLGKKNFPYGGNILHFVLLRPFSCFSNVVEELAQWTG